MSKLYIPWRMDMKQHIFLFPKLLLLLTILLLSHVNVFAQSKTIIGVVTDESKQTVPGVSVTVKGTKTTTQTDADGRYKIQALATDQLVFNYVGYASQSVTIGT